jgi:calcium/calmodulin-dependent protein kinase I
MFCKLFHDCVYDYVIFLCSLCGFSPFQVQSEMELFDAILNARFIFPSPEWEEISDLAKSFIKKILVVDPKARYTAEQCLQDAWITKYGNYDAKKLVKKRSTLNPEMLKDYLDKYKSK